jgi:hypothetical protein
LTLCSGLSITHQAHGHATVQSHGGNCPSISKFRSLWKTGSKPGWAFYASKMLRRSRSCIAPPPFPDPPSLLTSPATRLPSQQVRHRREVHVLSFQRNTTHFYPMCREHVSSGAGGQAVEEQRAGHKSNGKEGWVTV